MIHTDDFTHIRFRDSIHRVRVSSGYPQKFQGLLEAIHDHHDRGDDVLTVSHPGILGDTRGELLQSLSLIAEARLALVFRHSQQEARSLAEVEQMKPSWLQILVDRLDTGYAWLLHTAMTGRKKRGSPADTRGKRP